MNTIVALFEDPVHIDRAMHALESAGVPSERINVVSGPRERPAEDDTRETLGKEGASDLMVGLGAMSLPSFGPVLASGGLLPPLVGASTTRQSLLDDLVGAGVPRSEAEDYVDALHDGAAVVLVAADAADVDRVAQALAECGPVDVEHHARS